MRALSACKYESRQVRDEIMERLHTTKRKEYGQIEGMIDGLQGMAHCAYDAPHSIDVLEKIYTNLISKVEEMTFD
jgi:hypothetical protein